MADFCLDLCWLVQAYHPHGTRADVNFMYMSNMKEIGGIKELHYKLYHRIQSHWLL